MLKPAFVPHHTKMAAEKAIWTLFVNAGYVKGM